MTYLLDTNVISETRKPRPHGAVMAWLAQRSPEALNLSAFTLGELQKGVERTRRTDPAKAAEIERYVDRLASAYRVIPLDGAVCRRWARLMDGRSDALFEDALIAATALEHGLTVVSRNERDFAALGVAVLNPFTEPRSDS